MADQKDELIEAQKQVIGILFEVIKRLQSNNDLDDEYFGMITNNTGTKDRQDEIMRQRQENAKIAGRLLAKLEA